MSSDNPYGGPSPGQPGQGPVPGQGGTPSGQPSAGRAVWISPAAAGRTAAGVGLYVRAVRARIQPGGHAGRTTAPPRSAADPPDTHLSRAEPTAQWPAEPVEDLNHHRRRRGRRRAGPRNHRHRAGQP